LVTNYYGDDDICLLETYKHYTWVQNIH
jgi:hypothetical protein